MSTRGWMLFAAMSVIWGVPYLMIKVAVEGGISVPFLVFSRMAIGAALLVPIALLRGGLWTLIRAHHKPIIAFSLLEMIAPWWLLTHAEHDISSGMAGLLIAASPAVAVLVAKLVGDPDRLTAGRICGLALGFAGVLLLAMPELRGGSPRAVAEMAVITLLYATAPRIISGPLAAAPTLPMTAACLAFGAILNAVPAWLTRPTTVPDGPVMVSIVSLGLICTAAAFLVFFALIREVGPSRALVFTYVNPAVAVAAGVFFLGEPFTVSIAAAFAMILIGSLLAAARQLKVP